jgi:hypothetical protein
VSDLGRPAAEEDPVAGVLARAATAALLIAGAVACTDTPAQPAATPSPTYLLPARTARPHEIPVPSASAVSGPLTFTVLGLRAHLPALVGTHAEFRAKGEFARVRIAVQNDSATFYDLLTSQQLLVTADGAAHRPDLPTMEVTRQPDDISLGAQDRIEVDLWWDLPRGLQLRALRVTVKGGPPKDIPLPTSPGQ